MKQSPRMKDFEFKRIYIGSRLQNGPQYAYEIWYHNPNGKSARLKEIVYTKEGGRDYIRKVIKITEKLMNQKGEQK